MRRLARSLLGVERVPEYYLPWLIRPGLDCTLILSNVESRFRAGHAQGPFPITVLQYDAHGAPAHRYETTLPNSTAVTEVRLRPAPGNVGFATVRGEGIHSDLYVTLAGPETYAATHGRGEFVEHYPRRARVLLAVLGTLLALVGRTIPAFTRDQYAYAGSAARAHLLLMNLSTVTNRIRLRSEGMGGGRLVTLAPMGSALFDVTELVAPAGGGTAVRLLRLEGNAWFNLYLVGAGSRDLSGPLSLMHVK